MASADTAALDLAEVSEPLSLVPTWEVFPTDPLYALPVRDQRVAVVGATEADLQRLRQIWPRSVELRAAQDESLETRVAQLRGQTPIDHLIWVAPEEAPKSPQAAESDQVGDRLIEAQQRGVLSCFRWIKCLLAAGYGSRPLAVTTITRNAQAMHAHDGLQPAHAAVHGLMGAAAKEHTQWKVRVLDLEAGAPIAWHAVAAVPAHPAGEVWAYRHGTWYRRALLPLDPSQSHVPAPPYRHNGVYVVIGGAGGLGEVWTEHVIRSHQAHVIWIGRRALDAQIQAKQARFAALGPTPEYIQADACDSVALQSAREEIHQRHGDIHGIVHAAIVLQDKSLAQMTEERFEAALRAKVDVSVRMMQVFGREPLDFIVFFSSLMSFGTAPGQSNYAAGCAFKDAFAESLARLRPGRVKTLNWGYWGSVGVVASPSYRQRMASVGLDSIEPDEGMQALDVLLGSPLRQMAFMKVTWRAAQQMLRVRSDQRIVCHDERAPPQDANAPRPRALPEGLVQPAYGVGQRELDILLTQMLHDKLRSLGLLDGYPHRSSLAPQHERWLEESHRILSARELAVSPEVTLEWSRYRRKHQENHALAAQLDLVDRMLNSLGEVLSGRRWAVELLFPGGSIANLERTYENGPEVGYFNGVLVETLVGHLDAQVTRDPAARVHILEIGAGTGTTTAAVLAGLPAHRKNIARYTYTDVSQTFLRHGEERYGKQHPFLQFQLFDVERDPRGQSIGPGSYDVVIAANVLHATRDIRRTLRNAKAALARHGVLLLNEIVGNSLVAHLTFGLTPGWWRAEDTELRLRGGPALSAQTWERILWEEGFDSVAFPARDALATGMQIIVANSDGLVRQRDSAGGGSGNREEEVHDQAS